MNIRLSLSILATATVAVAAHAADFYTDFESANNAADPYGLKLGYYDSSFGTYQAFTAYEPVNPSDGLERWFDPANQNSLVPAAFKNVTGGAVHGFGPNTAGLHGGQSGEIAVASYTIATTGRYHISALFGTGDGTTQYGRVDDYVRVGGSNVFTAFNNPINASYNSYLNLTAGTTVEFAVGIGNDTFYNDSTPLSAQITAVPGPGALAVFGLGMVGKMRRRRKA